MNGDSKEVRVAYMNDDGKNVGLTQVLMVSR